MSVIDEEGSRVFDASYDAWGRQTVTKNEIGLRRGYTGHEMLNEVGIINMNGRLYDPLLGRFLSPDNYVQAPDNSQSFNRYSYCLNNPLKYVDPDGELWWLIPVIAGAYLGGSSVNGTFNPLKWDYGNWQTYAGMAVGGVSGYAGAAIGSSFAASALAGGASTFSAGVTGGIMGGIVSGGINGFGMTAVMGGNFGDMTQGLVKGSIIGGLGGALSGGISSAIGDFSGVTGSSLKNGLYELGQSALKGAATGLAGGAMMAAMEQDASYLWKGAAYGAAFGAGMAGIRIGLMGTTFIPDLNIYENLSDYGQIYRRGSIFMPRGSGITLGNNVSVKFTKDIDYNRYLLQHEIGHLFQINEMGLSKFYGTIAKEYIRHLFSKGGFYSVYTTPGTLDYAADQYAFNRLGYYFSNGIRYTFP